ncbi:hypothetical protein Tco_0859492 [Tanacetum coccineum]|uniref:Uncharacterized protein n=1 Tax=Tanacetum coccineum TaxID=301880 RepID=A0ABQ5BC54_9ASTR
MTRKPSANSKMPIYNQEVIDVDLIPDEDMDVDMTTDVDIVPNVDMVDMVLDEEVADMVPDEEGSDGLDLEELFGLGLDDDDIMPNPAGPNINAQSQNTVRVLNRHHVYNIVYENDQIVETGESDFEE